MRIGLIRRSHDLNQQRRRASSALNTDCAPPAAHPRLGTGLVGRRASSVVTDGGQDDNSRSQLKSRSMTIGGYRTTRQQDGESFPFSRTISQDCGGPDGRRLSQLVRQMTLTAGRGESTDEGQTEGELCNGKVLSVLAVILAVLLLTLGFAVAVRYLYR